MACSQAVAPSAKTDAHVLETPSTGDSKTPEALSLTTIIARLNAAGWPAASAKAVADTHGEWFGLLAKANPDLLEQNLLLLGDLGKHPKVMSRLADKPGDAGLFILVGDPTALAVVLGRKDDGEILAGLFHLHAVREDADRLLAAMTPENAPLIAGLMRFGLVGTENLFIFDVGDVGADTYAAWLRDVLGRAIQAGDAEGLSVMCLLLAEHGPVIRARLKSVERFRNAWPQPWVDVQEVAGLHPGMDITAYLDCPHLWEFMERPNAKELLLNRDLLAVDLLAGPRAIPEAVRAEAGRLLLEGDEEIACWLDDYRDRPEMTVFLESRLDIGEYAALAGECRADPARAKNRLKNRSELLVKSRTRFREELGVQSVGFKGWIPLYSIYQAGQKLADGETPTVMEFAEAGLEIAFTGVPGGSLATKLAVTGGKRLARGELAVAEVKNLARLSFERQGMKTAGLKLAPRPAVNKVIAGWLKGFMRDFAKWNSPLNLMTTVEPVDVTAFVRFMFDRFGFSRASFKQWTGLEARVNIRLDARLTLRFPPAGKIVLRSAGNRNTVFRVSSKMLNDGGYWMASAMGLTDRAEIAVP